MFMASVLKTGENMMNFAARLKIFLLCALMFVGACGLHDRSHSSNSNSSGSPSSATTAPTAGSPADAMVASINAQFAAKSYRARIEPLSEGKGFMTTVEYVAPDRFRIATPVTESVIVGPNTYVKLPTGQWQKIPGDVNQAISQFRDPKMIEELRNSTDAKFLGTDSIDGMPMNIYQYTVKNAFGTNMTTTSKAWVGVSDNLPRKMESEADVNGKPSKVRITYYDYNADIKIEPPM